MTQIFLTILNMSISASYLVLAVLLVRLLLKKAPKWITVMLWAMVAVRLICPFSVESALSLIPSGETVSPTIMTDTAPAIHSGFSALNSTINPIIDATLAPAPGDSVNPLQIWIPVLTAIWMTGTAAMLCYAFISYIRIRRKVAMAVRMEGNIYQSENVQSPFVLGFIKPKIYLPFSIDGGKAAHVIAHEKAHILRKDHLWKPLGFLLLAVHWFNPLMLIGYIFLCRDIELACDEKAIKKLDRDARADYSQALLSCSVSRKTVAACPLAFGEVGVRDRVKAVLNYKKPAFWLVTVAVIACTVVAVCFLTNPEEESNVPVSDPANIYGTYARGNESDPIPFTVTLWEDGVFQYYEAGISSHIGLGNYTFENGIVTLVDEAIPGVDGSLTRKYKFLYQDGNLVFLARESDKFTYITPPDCAVFQYVKPGDDVWKPEIGRK